MQLSFSQFSEVTHIRDGGRNFFEGTNYAERRNYLVPTSLFQEFQKPKLCLVNQITMHST